MALAVERGRIDEAGVQTFAYNHLTVIFPINNPANIHALHDLAKPGLKLVIGAKDGPQGFYIESMLTKASKSEGFDPWFKDRVYQNVVSYENSARGVVTKVRLGEADVGIAYQSDASGFAAQELGVLTIPAELNSRVSYTIAPLKDNPRAELANAFAELVLSPAGQAVLTKYGFLLPNQAP